VYGYEEAYEFLNLHQCLTRDDKVVSREIDGDGQRLIVQFLSSLIRARPHRYFGSMRISQSILLDPVSSFQSSPNSYARPAGAYIQSIRDLDQVVRA
jgi:hypothetical protein